MAQYFRQPRFTRPARSPAIKGPETIHRPPAQVHQIAPEITELRQEIAALEPGKGIREGGRKCPVEPRIPLIEKGPRRRRGLPYEEDADPFRLV